MLKIQVMKPPQKGSHQPTTRKKTNYVTKYQRQPLWLQSKKSCLTRKWRALKV